jgi:peptide/nickel transport system permease protein
MDTTNIVPLQRDNNKPSRPGFLARFVRNKRAVVGAILLTVFGMMAVFAPMIAPYEAAEQNILKRLSPPSADYLMGTDQLGRVIFSRAVYATRVSMPIGVFAMLVALTVGVVVGITSGYFGGTLDNVLMRLTDMLLTVTTLFGRTLSVLTLILGLTSWGVWWHG